MYNNHLEFIIIGNRRYLKINESVIIRDVGSFKVNHDSKGKILLSLLPSEPSTDDICNTSENHLSEVRL